MTRRDDTVLRKSDASFAERWRRALFRRGGGGERLRLAVELAAPRERERDEAGELVERPEILLAVEDRWRGEWSRGGLARLPLSEWARVLERGEVTAGVGLIRSAMTSERERTRLASESTT